MGIRIHKALGYGLTDVQFDAKKYKLTDPRFNTSSILTDPFNEKYSKENYKKFLLTKDSEDWQVKFEKAAVREKETCPPEDCFIYGTEYLSGNVFCCIPISDCKRWRRFDDHIDYYESSNKLENSVKILEDSIYPYIDYWDCRTGNRLDTSYSCAIRRIANAAKENKIDISQVTSHSEDAGILPKLGYKTLQEAIEFTKPAIPKCLEFLIEFSDVFVSKETIWQLKPMIYTYWS